MDRRALLAFLLLLPALASIPGGAAQSGTGLEVRQLDTGEAASGYPDEKRVFAFEVVNHEDEETSFLVNLNESSGALYLSHDLFGFTALPARSTRAFNVSVWSDASAKPGTYALRVDVKPYSSSVAGASHTWFYDLEPAPSWTLDVSGARPIAPGGSTTAVATLKNNGGATTDFLLDATSPDLPFGFRWDDASPTLAPGEARSLTLSIDVPQDAASDQYSIRVAAWTAGAPDSARSSTFNLWVDGSWQTFEPAPPTAQPVPTMPTMAVSRAAPTTLVARVPASVTAAAGTNALVDVTFEADIPDTFFAGYRASERQSRLNFAESSQGVLRVTSGSTTSVSLVILERAVPGVYELDLRFWSEDDTSVMAEATLQLVVEAGRAPPMLPKELDARFEPQPLRMAPGSQGEVRLLLRHERDAPVDVRLIERGATWHAVGGAVAVQYPVRAFGVAGRDTTTVPLTVRVADGASGEHRFEFQLEVTQGGVRVLREYATLVVLVDAAPASPLRAMSDYVKEHPVASATGFVLGSFALVTVPLWRREWWRYGAMLPLLPLYTRLQKREVLDHKTREKIHQMIVEQPGIHYSALKDATGLNAGALVHHLRTLERHGLVTSRREGVLRRFFPVGARLPPPPDVLLTPTQSRILELLDAQPMTQRELADRLGITQQGVSYHLKTLERKGQLLLERDAGEWRYYRVRDLAAQPAESAVS